jgi:hypothetical protein
MAIGKRMGSTIEWPMIPTDAALARRIPAKGDRPHDDGRGRPPSSSNYST